MHSAVLDLIIGKQSTKVTLTSVHKDEHLNIVTNLALYLFLLGYFFCLYFLHVLVP